MATKKTGKNSGDGRNDTTLDDVAKKSSGGEEGWHVPDAPDNKEHPDDAPRAATEHQEKERPPEYSTPDAPGEPAGAGDDTKNRAAARVAFPVVGIGSSAGGLEALKELLANMPTDTGMAFVIITHQHPDHTSLLPELLGRCSQIPVERAEDGVALQPDHIYVGPPGANVAIFNRVFQLVAENERHRPPLPIDYFFRSLAQDQKDCAVCIVLSGTGTDGTIGMREIKGESGMAIVQKIETARHEGMPASAIATGLADFVAPPSAMPAHLVTYARCKVLYGPTSGGAAHSPESEESLEKIFLLIRSRTGHDFSSYKPSTMRRRIERRMTVHQLDNVEKYARLLRQNPDEIDLLFRELLIGVTSFFRDPDAFAALAEDALPELMESRPNGYTFRIWIPGCGSGEEAYTIAILLQESMHKTGKTFEFQLFATDLDPEATESARAGLYPAGIAADVPPATLKHYFSQQDSIYRIRKEIRDMIVFAPQNVIKDPPFTRLDMISCRNLLIYLNTDLQKRLFPIFHYALKAGGLLMLGPSESIGGFGDLFTPLDKKWKIYQRAESITASGLPEFPVAHATNVDRSLAREQYTTTARPLPITAQLEKILLARLAPPAVVVNDRGEVVYIHGRTGRFLEPAPGQPSANIHDMAREGLQADLLSALREARAADTEIVRPRLRIASDGHATFTDLAVSKLTESETVRGLLLVVFRPCPKPPDEYRQPADNKRHSAANRPGKDAPDPESDTHLGDLERELRYTKDSLKNTVEELETSNEELKSMNEELQSTNEELQSTNEELETSKEEMQSLNEELSTVNSELELKVDNLSRANDDMQNLLNSTDIATVFLDNELRVARYTQRATKIIKLISTDLGRPLAHLATELRYERLVEDAREALRTLTRTQLEVESNDGTWLLVRIIPYRTAANAIEGVVITFVDISRTRKAEKSGQSAKELIQAIFDLLHVPSLVLDADLRVLNANSAFCRVFHTNLKKTVDQYIFDVGGGEWDLPRLQKALTDIIPKSETVRDFEVSGSFPKIGERVFRLNARRLGRHTGLPGIILLTLEDVTGGPAT